MKTLDSWLDAPEPISLESANRLAELQSRIDRKYIVDASTAAQLVQAMTPTMRALEIDGSRWCDYHSTYFDTPDWQLYRAAVQGRRHRYKVRSRTYGEVGPCFFEIKAKGACGTNVKTRIGYRRDHCDAITPAASDFIMLTTAMPSLADALAPVLRTTYTRSTMVDPASGTRITIDGGLCCEDQAGSQTHLDGIIVETKSARAPSPADRWLWEHRIRPSKISKFGTGLAVLHPELPANKWRRTIARHW